MTFLIALGAALVLGFLGAPLWAWFVGFAGDVVAGVWLGNDDGKPMRGVTGGGTAATIWRDFMTHALR